jgi:riboflavin kinase
MLTIISHLCSLSLSLSANLPTRALASSPALSRTGIYFGFARVLPQDAEDPDIAQAGEEHLTHPAGAREDQLAAAAAAASDEEWNDDSVVLGASPPPPHTQSAEAGFAEYLDARDASAAEGAGGPAPAAAAAAAAAGQKPRQMSAAAGRSVGSVMERVATTQGGGGGTPHAHQDGASPRPLDADASTQASSRDDGGAPSASSRRGKLKKPRVHLAEQDRGVYPFVMSLGYNPFYGNTQRTGVSLLLPPPPLPASISLLQRAHDISRLTSLSLSRLQTNRRYTSCISSPLISTASNSASSS